jgi:hypothetical protein
MAVQPTDDLEAGVRAVRDRAVELNRPDEYLRRLTPSGRPNRNLLRLAAQPGKLGIRQVANRHLASEEPVVGPSPQRR